MATHIHLPYAHVSHPHVDVDEHPCRALPLALIVILAVILIVASFAIPKSPTGHDY